MSHELMALSAAAWIFFFTSLIATYARPRSDGWFGRIFGGITRMVERAGLWITARRWR